jgi:hypothetical protein
MKSFELLTGFLLLCSSAFAQSRDRAPSVIDDEPTPCGDAVFGGTFHVSNGVFEPADSGLLPPVTPGVIYNNTINNNFFLATLNGTTVLDDGRVPSATSTSPVGTLNNYRVKGFQIAYCTRDLTGVFTVRARFWNQFLQTATGCTTLAAAGVPTADYTIPGLPGTTATGTLACWIVNIDLTGVEFCMKGDADGAFNTDAFSNGFGYGLTMLGQTGTTTSATGGFLFAGGIPPAAVTGVAGDGTYYQNPSAPAANGLDDDVTYRRDGAGGQTSGCFTLAANGLLGFWLTLTADLSDCTTCSGNPDSDGDGTPDCADGCPNDPNKIAPGICGCGVSDVDSDGDGTPDCNDGCPNDPNKIAPGVCGCGVADSTLDSDGDGTPDCIDGCPNDPNKIAPGVCGCGVAESTRDSDGDGTPDCIDGCPNDPNKIAPGVCGCGVSDVDTDGDGTPDCHDGCPTDPFKIARGACGCGIADVDSDGDGTPDCNDGCPNDPKKIAPGACGCGVADVDTDGDGTPDCHDGCPSDPNKIARGQCGCGVPDTDSDGDGTANCNDGCPNDPLKVAPGSCGCGVADVDTDGDGILDCHDNCPHASNPGQADIDGDGVGDACDNCVHISNASQADCNGNGIGDACEIAGGAPDCNFNGVPDACDIANHTSADVNGNGIPDECELNGGTPFCFGDGHPNCPCSNNSASGADQGCKNSTGVGGKLLGTGLTQVSADGLVLHASNMVQGVCVFLQGDSVTSAVFGDGLRCAGGQLRRLATKSMAAGAASYPQGTDPKISVLGLVPPSGGVRYYQVFYRNPNGSPCGALFNITSGVNVIWQP